MLETLRDIDKKIEFEVEKYCDTHLYGNGIFFRRCSNRDLQKSGIDGYLSIPSLGIDKAPADEKVGIHYVNRPISTYLMELSQITSAGNEVDGWFLSNESKTEYYILMYLWASVPGQYREDDRKIVDYEWALINRNNIGLVEYYIVSKRDIMKYLDDCGFPEERLRRGVNYLRNNPSVDKVETQYGFKFVISRSFRECPVNVCINKSIYNRICLLHGYAEKFDTVKL